MTSPPKMQDSRLVIEDRVATLTLDRHDVRNELTGTNLIEDIVSTVNWINAEDAISVLVLTGAGSAFSSGGNIKHMLAREGSFGGDVYAVQRQYRLGIQRIALAMHSLEIPSIAAINGHAIGAGFDLACMCDLRFAATTAKMGETFVNVGLIPGDGGAWLLQRLVGYQRAAELSFTGRVFGADEALKLGLLLEIIEPDVLLTRVQAFAHEIASKPPQALRMSKRLLRMAQHSGFQEVLELSGLLQGIAHNTADHLEAVSAAIDKRQPRFVGI